MAARARAQAGPAQSYAALIVAAGVAGAGVGTWFGYPGAAAVLVALVVAGWLEQAPPFTGKKNASGYPTPAHPGEQKAMNTYRFWADVRWRLLVPTGDWLPGWPVLGSWLGGLAAAAAVSFVPVDPELPGWAVYLNMLCAFAVAVQVPASRRRTVAEDDPCPGTRVDTLPALVRADKKQAIALAVAVVAAVATSLYVVSAFVPQWLTVTGPLGSRVPAVFWVLVALGAAGGVVARPWQTVALATWRQLVAVRREWAPRWQVLKQDPAPFLVAHRTVGPATVDTFDAPAGVGAAFYYGQAAKITPTLGANMRVAVLETPNLDGQGQPVPGSMHPLRFEVVQWPADQVPDVAAPDTDPAVAELLARSAMAWAADMVGFARFVLTGCDLVTEPGTPAVWVTQWAPTMEIGLDWVRKQALGAFAGAAGTGLLIDHRAMNRTGLVFIGAVHDPAVQYTDQSGITADAVAWIAEEDEWNSRWAVVLKQNVNAPVPQREVKAVGRLADGTEIHHQPFVTLSGEDPAQYMTGLEGKLAATIPGSAPFMSIAWFTMPGTDRSGARHAQALTVSYSARPVPSVHALAPVRGDAPRWVLSGHINSAFTAARLARPEVTSVKCLTAPKSREHIWQINIRLYGGATLSDVRGAANRIRGELGCTWMRVAPAEEGCTIFAGGAPRKVKLARPQVDTPRLASLDWEQAWVDSKVTGVAGLVPTLTGVDHLPKNDQVQVLDFDLPPGLSVAEVKAATEKLKTATGNAFIEVRAGTGSASTVRMLVCEVNPMPEYAPFDFDAIDAAEALPFASGIEGEPIEYDVQRDPHLLVVGGTGSGKSATLQALIYPVLAKGYDVYIADPTKGGADFRFALPWVKAFAVDIFDAAAMMNAVYEEVTRRKNLNAEYGVGSYLELPEEVRPRHAVVVLDEFTSLMMTDSLEKPDVDDEAAVREYELASALNSARKSIGSRTGRVAREARSAGFTLLLATQRLTAKTLDTIPGASDLRTNLSRLILGKATFGELQSALKDPQSAPALGESVPKGRGILEMSGVATQMVQSWYIGDIQRVLAEQLEQRIPRLTDAERLDLAPFMPRRPDDEPGQRVVPTGPVEPVVIELEEMELSLDDLEATSLDGDGEKQGGDLPPWAAAFAEAGDAPTSPQEELAGLAALEAAQDDSRSVRGAAGGTAVPPRVPDLWGDEDDTAGQGPGPDDAAATVIVGVTVPHRDLRGTGDVTGWETLDGLLTWLDAHPHITRVEWTDPALGEVDDLDVLHRDLAEEVLTERGLDVQLTIPDAPAPAPDPVSAGGVSPDTSAPGDTPWSSDMVDDGDGHAPAEEPAFGGVRLTAPVPDEW